MNISEISTRDVVTCGRGMSVRAVAQLMRDRHVGDVIVVDEGAGGGKLPVGIVTDRDLVVRVLAKAVDAEAVTAGDVMGDALATALATEAVYEAVWHMRRRGIRRLPVVDAHGLLVGVVTADDITAFLAGELADVARIAPRQTHLEQQAFELA